MHFSRSWDLVVAQAGRRNSQNQDFISEPAWSINSRQMESGPAAFPGFRYWRADVSSSAVKSLERL